MKPGLVLCLCRRWHAIAVRATERYRHRFRCGLSVVLNAGVTEFRYKGATLNIGDLAGGKHYLFIKLKKLWR